MKIEVQVSSWQALEVIQKELQALAQIKSIFAEELHADDDDLATAWEIAQTIVERLREQQKSISFLRQGQEIRDTYIEALEDTVLNAGRLVQIDPESEEAQTKEVEALQDAIRMMVARVEEKREKTPKKSDDACEDEDDAVDKPRLRRLLDVQAPHDVDPWEPYGVSGHDLQ